MWKASAPRRSYDRFSLFFFFNVFAACLCFFMLSEKSRGLTSALPRSCVFYSLCDYHDAQCEALDEGETFLRGGLSLEAARQGGKEGNSAGLRKGRGHELDTGQIPWFFLSRSAA